MLLGSVVVCGGVLWCMLVCGDVPCGVSVCVVVVVCMLTLRGFSVCWFAVWHGYVRVGVVVVCAMCVGTLCVVCFGMVRYGARVVWCVGLIWFGLFWVRVCVVACHCCLLGSCCSVACGGCVL